MLTIRAADCPRSLHLLKVELAQEHRTTPDLVSVYEAGHVVQSEQQYRAVLSANSMLAAEVQPGNVDHFGALKEAIRNEHLVEGLKSAAETICAGNQKVVRKMDLHDMPSLNLRQSVLPFFPCLTRLSSLHLNAIILSRVQIAEVVAVLPESLEFLLIDNIFLDTAVANLSQRLQVLDLRQLTLRNNVLEATGMKVLADGLKKQRGLTYLNIEQNGLGSEGGKWLISVLPHLRSLNFLEVRFNCFSESDLSQLVRAMTIVASLHHFSIDGNDVTESTCRTVCKYLSQFDMNAQGYFLATHREPQQEPASLRWGRMRNLVTVRELLRQRAPF